MTRTGRAVFTLLLLGGALWLLAETLTLGGPARLAPIWVIAPTCVLLTILSVLEIRARSRHAGTPDPTATTAPAGAVEDDPRRGEASALLWFAGLVVMVLAAGVLTAVPVFFFLYAAFRWQRTWWIALGIGAAAFTVLYLLFTLTLGIYLPPGWLWPD